MCLNIHSDNLEKHQLDAQTRIEFCTVQVRMRSPWVT
jgi:hypothetical protein